MPCIPRPPYILPKRVTPIRPNQVADAKLANIPDFVLEAFNECIAENFSDNSAIVLQHEVVNRILKKWNPPEPERLARPQIIANKWLDVEPLYRQAGWKVTYDRPGYNETYPASFTFSK